MAALEKWIVPESPKTKRAREKLIKKWEEEKACFTQAALKDTIEKIHKWIGDNSKHRLPVKKKSIRLFNQNKDAAKVSKKVQEIAAQLDAKETLS